MTTATIADIFDLFNDPAARAKARVSIVTCGTDTPLPDDYPVWQGGKRKTAGHIADNNGYCYDGTARQERGFDFRRARSALYFEGLRVTHIEYGLKPGTYDVFVKWDCLLAGPDDVIAVRRRRKKKAQRKPEGVTTGI